MMKRIILITILIVGFAAGSGFADMRGHMSGQGMMGQGYSSEEASEYSQGMMGYGGYGMMRGGMMGQGRMGGYGMMGSGMMGQGHMGGYGMMGSGMMYGYGSRSYSAEEYEEYKKEYQQYMDETVELRKKLHNKRFDYYEALRDPDTTRKALLKLEKEMMDLQWKIYEKVPE